MRQQDMPIIEAYSQALLDAARNQNLVEQVYGEAANSVPIGRAGRPEEIASVVLWLSSPGASYVVGHGLTVDGGMTVA